MKKSPTILLAEDEESDRFLLANAFDQLGVSDAVKMFVNGDEVFQYLDSISDPGSYPGLIILDGNMPVRDGLQTLTDLKGSSQYRSIPVVMLSSQEDSKFRKKCLDTGAMSYVVKPQSYSLNFAYYLYDLLKLTTGSIEI